jgi:hypothetical protein
MRSGLGFKNLPCSRNDTRQLRRLEAGGTGAHVEFHPVSEHETHPGFPLWEDVRARRTQGRAPLWGYLRDAHWRLGYPIEPSGDLGKRHSGLLQLADVDEAFQVRRGVMWSAPRPERRGQEPALDVVTHGAARDPP